MFASGRQAEWHEMPIPGPPVTVGIDGGYVRNWADRPANFEVIVGKSVPEDGPARRFGFVVSHDKRPKRRLHELLVSQRIANLTSRIAHPYRFGQHRPTDFYAPGPQPSIPAQPFPSRGMMIK